MIEELLKANRISLEDYKLYMLYQVNELGREVLDKMMYETFMDEPLGKEYKGVGFAFFDGRRSVFRDIRRAILNIEYELKREVTHDDRKPESESERRR